jgi:hypothetical protein
MGTITQYQKGRQSVIRAATVTAVLVLVAAAVLMRHKPPQPSPQRTDSVSIRRTLRTLIASQSIESAYEQAKVLFPRTKENAIPLHTTMHIFGELAYQQMGLSAVNVCDEAFVYGCYHGVFTQAIVRRGMEVIPELFSVCRKRNGNQLACEHGIGHGLLDYLGYGRLSEALDQCRRAGAQLIPFGCIGGVFMEYNFPAFSLNPDVSIRSFGEKDPYAPCGALPHEFYSACVFRLTEWWEQVFHADYRKMGDLCSGVADVPASRYCFIGIGSASTVTGGYEPNVFVHVCTQMPDSDGRADCIAGSSWEFARNRKLPDYTGLCHEAAESEPRCEASVNLMREWVGADMISG